MHDPYGTTDYREFLVRALAARGMGRREFSRSLGRSLGWASQVLSGLRSLDPELAPALASMLDLDADAAAWLSALIDLESRSPRARRAARAAVAARLRQRAVERGGAEVAASFASWIVPATLELARCEGFRNDPAWIARTLSPPVEPAQAADAVRKLVELGLLVDGGGGTLAPGATESWSPSDLPSGEVSSAAVSLHRAGLELGAEALGTHRQNERHFSTVVMAVPEAAFPRLVAKLRELERELVLTASETDQAPNRVYHLGIQLFPVSLYSDTETDPDDE